MPDGSRTNPPETPKERKRRLDSNKRAQLKRRMNRNGYVAIPDRTWVQKETLEYFTQLFGAENIGNGLDMLATIIQRSDSVRGAISDRRQEAKHVTRYKIDQKRMLLSPMGTVMNRLMDEGNGEHSAQPATRSRAD